MPPANKIFPELGPQGIAVAVWPERGVFMAGPSTTVSVKGS